MYISKESRHARQQKNIKNDQRLAELAGVR